MSRGDRCYRWVGNLRDLLLLRFTHPFLLAVVVLFLHYRRQRFRDVLRRFGGKLDRRLRLILHLAGGKIGFQDRQVFDILLLRGARVADQQFRGGGNFLIRGGHRATCIRPLLVGPRPLDDGIIFAHQLVPAKYFLHVLYRFRGQAYRVVFRVAIPRLRSRSIRVIARVHQLLLLVLRENIEIV